MDSATSVESPPNASERSGKPATAVDRLADACVKCGLCLPHCPTYQIANLEGESPRGRIALIQGLVSGQLPAGGRTVEHLESCTGCLNCEAICPAGVRYGELIDMGRAELRRRGHEDRWTRWLNALAGRPQTSRMLLALLRWARRLGIRRIAPAVGIGPDTVPGRILARLPAKPLDRAKRQPFNGPHNAERVMLFIGCVTSSLDRQTLEDAIGVLNRCGHNVVIPPDQDCCGALDLHSGNPRIAARLATKNIAAFGSGNTPILTLATGCGVTLDEYDRLTADDSEDFCRRMADVGAFLHDHWRKNPPCLAPLPVRVALFQPCTARNNRRRQDRSAELLQRIPALDLHRLNVGFGCCGAAGHHFLTRRAQADQLAAPILEEILALDPDHVAVSNVGCALHLAGALAAAGHRATVLHPVSLLRLSLAGDG
jgi:glycolate oxidase iron-sulfur subunit